LLQSQNWMKNIPCIIIKYHFPATKHENNGEQNGPQATQSFFTVCKDTKCSYCYSNCGVGRGFSFHMNVYT